MKKYQFDPNKNDDRNLTSKVAQMRELIWDKYPDNQGEMIACPFSALSYYEDYTLELLERVHIAELLINKICAQVKAPSAIKEPIYTANPSFQQMVCLSGFITKATNEELIDKMKKHDWYKNMDDSI